MRKIVVYRQLHELDCSYSCIQAVARHFGTYLSRDAVAEKLALDLQGASVFDICKTLEAFGFEATAIRVSDAPADETVCDLATVPLPVIVHLDRNHYAVLYRIRNGHFYLMDPAKGLVRLPAAAFYQRLNHTHAHGTCIFVRKGGRSATATGGRPEPATGVLQKLRLVFSGFRPRSLVPLLLLLLASQAAAVATPFISQKIFDNGILKRDQYEVLKLLPFQVALFLVASLMSFGVSAWSNRILYSLNQTAIGGLWKKLFRIRFAFMNGKKQAYFMQVLQDYSKVENFLSYSLLNVAVSLLSALLYSIIIGFYSKTVLAITLVSSTLYFLLLSRFDTQRGNLYKSNFDTLVNAQEKLLEGWQNNLDFRFSTAYGQRFQNWHKDRREYYENTRATTRITHLQTFAQGFILNISSILTTFYLSYSVIRNDITIGEMIAVQMFVAQLSAPLSSSLNALPVIQECRIALARIYDLMNFDDVPEAGQEAPGRVETLKAVGVTYAYQRGASPALSQASLTAAPGQMTAVVGASGCGKSTLLKLLAGVYTPTAGSVLLNDSAIDRLAFRGYRTQLGPVFQESRIFTDTILNNVCDLQTPDLDRFRHCLELACAHEFVTDLPRQHLTTIGVGGTALSGGQMQRLLLARSFYKAPSIYLLDEATSALDARSERHVMQSLKNEARSGKIVVYTSHSKETLSHADVIYVMDKGAVVAHGSHAALSESCILYQELFG